jgi:hypothetical protein
MFFVKSVCPHSPHWDLVLATAGGSGTASGLVLAVPVGRTAGDG